LQTEKCLQEPGGREGNWLYRLAKKRLTGCQTEGIQIDSIPVVEPLISDIELIVSRQ